MKYKKYLSMLQESDYGLRSWKLVAILMAFSNVAIILLSFSMSGREKTIVMPSFLHKQFWIEGETLSKSYIEQVGLEVFQGILNYNPENVQYQFNNVLKYVDGSYYQTLRTILNEDVKRVKKNQISSVFFPISLESKENRVTVEGEHMTIIGKVVTSKDIKKFVFHYSTKSGQFKITKYGVIDDKS